MIVRVCDSIAQIGREAWDALFPGEIETWDYYRAVEQSQLPGFAWRYLALYDGDALVAAAPAFLTDYRLDTTVTGGLKRLTERLARWLPRLMSIRMLCLGSPVSEICHAGLLSQATLPQQQARLRLLLEALRDAADREGARLVAIKDVPQGSLLDRTCRAARYTALPGMPTAVLPIGFANLETYLQNLSRATRKDIKRKLRHAGSLRVEARRQIDDVLPRIMALYEATWQRSELRLEHLTPEYFRAVLRHMPERATCYLYWEGERLAAFNLVLHDGQRMIDKFFGTDGNARRLNLYHLSWMENLRQCLWRGLQTFQAGQAFYGEKVRMGSRLDVNWLFFGHRSPIMNLLLRLVSRLARLDRLDPEIRKLMARVK